MLYQGKQVEYDVNTRVVDLSGDVQVDYGALTLTAGKVRFFTDRRYLEASEEPVLVEKEGGEERKVVGSGMDYNLNSREGTIAGGRTRAEDGFIYADRLRKIGEDQFLARNGSYTTCDNIEHGEEPHYHFTSKRMRIYLKDKVVAKPVTLYIRDIPVFALPFYVFSIRKGRQSGFLTPDFDFGLGGSTGRFFRNLGYYWAASQYYDLTVSTQYTEADSRFVGTVQGRYAKRYLMDGNLSFSRTLGRSSQYELNGAHNMTLGNWRLSGVAEFRSASFRQQQPLTDNVNYRLDRELRSNLSLSRRFSAANLTVTASQYKDLAVQPGDGVDDVIRREQLPNYSFSLNSFNLGRRPDAQGEGGVRPWLSSTRVSFSSSGGTTYEERETTTYVNADTVAGTPADTLYGTTSDRSSRATHRLTVTDSRKLLGAFDFIPSVTLTEYWVDREFSAADTTRGFRRAAVWSAGLGTGTTLYGTFPGLGPVEGLRHVFQPSVSLNFQPEFRGLSYRDTLFTRTSSGTDTSLVRRNRFPGVGATKQEYLRFSVRNALKAKVRGGETVRRLDLLNWDLSSSYNLLAAEQGTRAWSAVTSNLDLTRILGVDVSFHSTHDPYHGLAMDNFQTTAGFGLGGVLPGQDSGEPVAVTEQDRGVNWDRLGANLAPSALNQVGSQPAGSEALSWNARFGLSYTGSRDFAGIMSTATTLRSSASVQITRNWGVSYDNTWDLTEGRITQETVSLRRDLHCWEAMFTRTRLFDENAFYFRINVKSMPDIKYEQGQRSDTGFGALGSLLP